MSLSLSIGAVQAVNRPALTSKPASKPDSPVASKARSADSAEVTGRVQAEPAAVSFGLAEARAAVAGVRDAIVGQAEEAMLAQSRIAPRLASGLLLR
jgi:hypothetical protein